MNIVFLGTPDFAVLPLQNLINSKHNVLAVVTQPDKPVGRKQILTPSPVKVVALENDLPVYQFQKIRLEGVEVLRSLNPDVMITCAFGQILSQEILDIAKYGVLNIHASLLPKYRGAAPIQWSIINGDKETGITIMKTDVGIDTGDILLKNSINIKEDETAGELFDRLSVVGAESILTALEMLENGSAKFGKQDEMLATHVKMLKKEDGKIDWNLTSCKILNLIRGLNPWPVAYTFLNNTIIKIYRAKAFDGKGKAGEVLFADKNKGLVVATSDGAVEIKELQAQNGKRMDAKSYLLGNKIEVGSFFS